MFGFIKKREKDMINGGGESDEEGIVESGGDPALEKELAKMHEEHIRRVARILSDPEGYLDPPSKMR